MQHSEQRQAGQKLRCQGHVWGDIRLAQPLLEHDEERCRKPRRSVIARRARHGVDDQRQP
jgi:hypothetical protein